ncbi:MAG: hypothetical protein HW380_3701 [Magnetococcales bacterium]|nr:hypothetical protein [Magnetococcales bacterium]
MEVWAESEYSDSAILEEIQGLIRLISASSADSGGYDEESIRHGKVIVYGWIHKGIDGIKERMVVKDRRLYDAMKQLKELDKKQKT